jgi:hypothetical protein
VRGDQGVGPVRVEVTDRGGCGVPGLRSAGREAGGDWGLRLEAALAVWQGWQRGSRKVTRPGRAVNGICARRWT